MDIYLYECVSGLSHIRNRLFRNDYELTSVIEFLFMLFFKKFEIFAFTYRIMYL